MCSKGSGSPPVPGATSTAFQSATAANPNVAPMYQQFLSNAYNLSQTPFNPAMLGSVAPLDPMQTQGAGQLFNLGMNLGNFDPSQVQSIESPYTQDVVQATQDWFNNQNQIQGTNLMSQAIRSGNAFGGDRAGIAEAQLAGEQQLAQAPVIAGLRQAGYTQALNEYNQLKQYGLTGAQAALGAGTVEQQQAQRELDVAQQNAMMGSAYPFQIANWYGSTLGGVGPLQGTSALGYTTPPPPSVASQVGAIVGPLAGAAASFFGQKRGGVVAPRHRGGIVIPVRARGGLVPMRLQSGGLSGDVDTGDTAISQLSIPSYGNAPPNALDWIQRQMRQQKQQQQQPSTASDIGSLIKSVGGAAIKLAPLLALERGGLVRLYQDGGDTDGYEDEDNTPANEYDAPDTAAPATAVSALPPAPVTGGQPPPMSPSGTFPEAGTPETRLRPGETPPFDPTAGGESPTVPTPRARPAAAGPPAPQGGLGPVRGGGGYGGRPDVTTIPGLNTPRPSFLQRWLQNPLTQMGAAMGASRSPYWSVALGQGFQAAGEAAAKQQKEDLLDQHPQMMDVDGKIAFRQGNKVIKTAFNSPKGRGAGRGAGASGQAESQITQWSKLYQATLKDDPLWGPQAGKTEIERLDEADRLARERWNKTHPDAPVPAPQQRAEVQPSPQPPPQSSAETRPPIEGTVPMTVTGTSGKPPPPSPPPPAAGTAVAEEEAPSTVGVAGQPPVDDIPDPPAIGSRNSEAIKLDGIRYLRTGKYPTGISRAADKPVRDAITNYAAAVAKSRHMTADQVIDMWQYYPRQAGWLLGADGRTLGALGTLIDHLDTLRDLTNALKNGDNTLFNKVRNRVSAWMGSELPTNVQTAAPIIGTELMKAIGAAGAGTGVEREAAGLNIGDLSKSPQQFLGAIDVVQRLAAGQLDTKYRQGSAIFKDVPSATDRLDAVVGKRALQILKRRERPAEGGGGTTGGGGGAPAASQEHPDRWQGGYHYQWDASAGKYRAVP
jgi:hypothetical protein